MPYDEYDGYNSITERNVAMRRQAEGKAEALRRKMYDQSPVGAFQNRMAALKDVPRYALPRGQSISPEPFAGPAPDADGGPLSYNDSMWDGHAPGATVLPNSRAGKVRVMTDEAMSPEQRQQIANAAMNEDQPEMLRGTVNGQSFEMAPSGPRVSGAKAKSFLALAQQASADREKREQLAIERQREDEDRAERKRQQALTEKNAAEDRQHQLAREAYNDQLVRMKNERGMRQESTAGERRMLEDIVSSPTAGPQRKADAMRRLAQLDAAVAFPQAPSTGDGPFFGAMQGPLAAAFAKGAQGASDKIANDPLYNADPREVKAWETRRDNETNMAAAQAVKDALSIDPVISGEMRRVRDELASLQNEGAGHKIARWLNNIVFKSPGGLGAAGDYEDYTIKDEHVKYVSDTATYLANLAAQRTGQDPAVVKAIILGDLRDAIQGTTGVGAQLRGALR